MRIPRSSFFAAGLALTASLCILRAQAPPAFSVGNAVSSEFEDGPPLGEEPLVPGDAVYFSFTAANFTKSPAGRVQITGHVQLFDSQGTPIAPQEDIPLITTLSAEDKNWKPKLRAAFSIPPIAPPGSYKLKYDATDELSHQSASGVATFGVQAKFVAPSAILAIRELNFYRDQQDTTALITPAYKAGDMVWVKFYMTGYKQGEQNSIDASYDVEVLNAEGVSIMKKEDAAMQKSTAYYPQPYIPGIFNLSLKSTMSHNEYTLVITAHDNVGNQTATASAKFQVN